MKIIRNSNENEFILNFLQGELSSERFSNDLQKAIKKLKVSPSIVLNPNLEDEKENLLRKSLLGEFRGYGKNVDLFENFPNIKSIKFATLEKEDLEKIKYINYSYWNKLSSETSSPIVASENIKNGLTAYNVSNEKYFQGAQKFKDGFCFPPVILLTHKFQEFIILEGHSRITIYSLCKDVFKSTKCYILECSKQEIENWNK